MNTLISTTPIKPYPQIFYLAICTSPQQPVTKGCVEATRMQNHQSLWCSLRLLAFLSAVQMFNVCPVGAASSSTGQNWPQWRGPVSTGVAPAGKPPTTWSETMNVRWKVKIPGTGSATPIVWNNQVFVQTAIPTGKKVESPGATTDSPTAAGAAASPAPGGNPPEGQRGGRGFGPGPKPTEFHQFVVLALDRATGKVLWQKTVREEVPHEGHHPKDGTFASSSPVTDGQNLFAYFGSRGLHSYDLQGNLKWQKDLGRMQTKMNFGEGNSPALFGNTIVVNWDHEGEDFIVALNKDDGKELWRQPRNEDTSWSTPLIVEHQGQRQVIVSATKKIRSYDLSSGKQLWECGGMTANAIPTPVPGEGMVYVTSGFRGHALLAIRLGRTGDLTGTDAIAWSHNKNTPYVPSSLLYGDKLYFFSGNKGVLSSFDAKSGRPLIDGDRIEAIPDVYSSPVGADGRVYLVGRNGVTVVIKHADTLEVLATNRLEEKFDASPAIAGKDLFLRGQEYLYCIAEK